MCLCALRLAGFLFESPKTLELICDTLALQEPEIPQHPVLPSCRMECCLSTGAGCNGATFAQPDLITSDAGKCKLRLFVKGKMRSG